MRASPSIQPPSAGLCFDLPLRASRRVLGVVLLVHLVGLLGLALGADALSGRVGMPLVLCLAVLPALAILASLTRSLRPPAAWGRPHTLRVDASGQAVLLRHQAPPLPVAPRHWFVGGGVAWIHARADRSGQPQGRASPDVCPEGVKDAWSGPARALPSELRLLVGFDTLDVADRARLGRWLRWLDRGGGPAGH